MLQVGMRSPAAAIFPVWLADDSVELERKGTGINLATIALHSTGWKTGFNRLCTTVGGVCKQTARAESHFYSIPTTVTFRKGFVCASVSQFRVASAVTGAMELLT